MKSKPFLSFVLPTKDRPDLLKICLSFLTLQECRDFEVIIADNSLCTSSKSLIEHFLKDDRFQYFKPSSSLSMPDNWDFAIEYATGEYITIINEKFMFHPKAVGWLKLAAESHIYPDIMSWQFEHFAVSVPDSMLGHYHPLFKPVKAVMYSALEELQRRFTFQDPLFSRHSQEKISYGKIYAGAVRKVIVDKVKKTYGRVFIPMSPDFTSMVCFLNFSERCLDMGRSLMMLIAGKNLSNGDTTKSSLPALIRYIEETSTNPKKYVEGIIYRELYIGHTVFIASDYEMIQALNHEGNLSKVTIQKPAVLGWIKQEMNVVQDWGNYSQEHFERIYERIYSNLEEKEKIVADGIQELFKKSQLPSIREIYHSGLEKVDFFESDICPEKLANYHWVQSLALPRKPVSSAPQSIDAAMNFFIRYSNCSVDLLSL